MMNVPKVVAPWAGARVASGAWVLAGLAMACAGGVGVAALRHTGSLAFPIDDAYIYSNYVLYAAHGHLFTYNDGELSGGITSFSWYVLCTLAYWLISPLHDLLGVLAPPVVRADAALSAQAGHVYLAAYLPGLLCHAATVLGVYRLAQVTLPLLVPPAPGAVGMPAHRSFCWLLGAVAAADAGLVWGAMSGLEVPLASAVAVWSVYLLALEAGQERLRWSLLLAGLLMWARPELITIVPVGALWLVVRGVTVGAGGACPGSSALRWALRSAAVYMLAGVVGAAALCLVYLVGWGKPFPGSFYAKVGGLRLGIRFFSAALELWLAGRFLPFVAGAVAVAGGLLGWLWPPAVKGGGQGQNYSQGQSQSRLNALLLLMVGVAYVAAVMVTLPWFGQEDRYLLPIHPIVIVLMGLAVWLLVGPFLQSLHVWSGRGVLAASAAVGAAVGAAAVCVLLVVANYWWATRNYVVEVRNITDAHVVPARWLSANTPPDAVVAAEPIGAVRLFSERRTIDLVGLTTPVTLGTYGNWPLAGQVLRRAGARYLLYYPDWFGRDGPPVWAVERKRFPIPDNRIAGADVIAVYELSWDGYP